MTSWLAVVIEAILCFDPLDSHVLMCALAGVSIDEGGESSDEGASGARGARRSFRHDVMTGRSGASGDRRPNSQPNAGKRS